MKLDKRLQFINDPIFIIAFTLFVITLLAFIMYKEPKKVKVKVKQPTEVTINFKKSEELSNWRYGYYEHLYYTN
jgi:hypothetical protein